MALGLLGHHQMRGQSATAQRTPIWRNPGWDWLFQAHIGDNAPYQMIQGGMSLSTTLSPSPVLRSLRGHRMASCSHILYFLSHSWMSPSGLVKADPFICSLYPTHIFQVQTVGEKPETIAVFQGRTLLSLALFISIICFYISAEQRDPPPGSWLSLRWTCDLPPETLQLAIDIRHTGGI